MAFQIEKQFSLFDLPDEPVAYTPGQWVDAPGEELTFEQACQMVGKLIVVDHSTEAHRWYKVELLEKVVSGEDGRRLVLYDGHRQRGFEDERWFDIGCRFPYRIYCLPGETVPFACADCVFDCCGICQHEEGKDWYCVKGSFRVSKNWQCKCGRKIDPKRIRQDDMGSDAYYCSCGTVTIFNNRGNRPSAFDLWKRGELVGV